MAFRPTAPETKSVSVQTTEDRELDTYHVHNLEINQDPNDPMVATAKIIWSRGFKDGEGKYQAQEFFGPMVLSGANLLVKFQEEPPAGRNIYDVVKHACWELLITEGHLPEGSIL